MWYPDVEKRRVKGGGGEMGREEGGEVYRERQSNGVEGEGEE